MRFFVDTTIFCQALPRTLFCCCKSKLKSAKDLIVSYRLMYVRNASGLVRDGARLLHILVILFIVIWISHRNIAGILILYSSKGLRSQGFIILSRNICTKANTTVLTHKFQTFFFINGFLYGLAMTACYLIALKTRYKQSLIISKT